MQSAKLKLLAVTLLSSTILASCDGGSGSDSQSSGTFGGSQTQTELAGNSGSVATPLGDTSATIPTPPGPEPIVPQPEPIVIAHKCTSSLPEEGWTSESKLKYHVSAISEKIVRIRVGEKTLPRDESWAVLAQSRKAMPCSAGNDTLNGLKTDYLEVTKASDSQLTVRDKKGNVLWEDVGTPSFSLGGAVEFSSKIPDNSRFYGLGDMPDSIDKSGKKYTFLTTEAGGFTETKNQLYKSIPYYIRNVNGTYTGYFYDNTWRTTFDFGSDQKGVLKASAAGGGVDFYIISGDTPKEVVQNYAKLTGTAPLPNLWALGWQQSKWSYTCRQVAEVAKDYRSRQIPADVLWLDIGFLENNIPFTVGADYRNCAFTDINEQNQQTDFKGLIKYLADQSFKTVVIADLHIAALRRLAGGETYSPYIDGLEKDLFIKNAIDVTGRPRLNADGTRNIQAPVWPAQAGSQPNSVFPDFSYKPAMDWWGTLARDYFLGSGVAGFWNDMNEPDIFVNAPGFVNNQQTPDLRKTLDPNAVTRIYDPEFGFEPLRISTMHETRNTLGMLNSRGTYEGLLKLDANKRPYVMTRATYVGGHRYSTTWTGDNTSTYADLRMATNQITSLGLAGFNSGADIGGFQGSAPSQALLTRWIQIGSFYPVARDHYITNKPYRTQEPYVRGSADDFTSRTKYIRNRYILMPYLYTLAEEMERTGLPLMRRMFLEFPNATQPGNAATPIDIAAETQFMVGPDLLVAPSPVELGFAYPTAPFGVRFEAETTRLMGPTVVENNHRGFSGSGFVGGFDKVAPKIGFNTANLAANQYSLQIVYANFVGGDNLTTSRTLGVLVNGTRAATITLPPGRAWTDWRTERFTITLPAGASLIELTREAGDSGSVNIDAIALTALDAPMPPVVAGQSAVEAYDVSLPAGDWYDYWSGKKLTGESVSQTASWKFKVENPSLFELPVYVRAGAILPKVPAATIASIRSTQDVQKVEQLELVVYPGDRCEGSIYTDDGGSFEHTKGNYYRRAFTCSKAGNQLTVNFSKVEGQFKPSWKNVKVSVAGSTSNVVVNEVAAASSVQLQMSE